jgi:hypothetical protein
MIKNKKTRETFLFSEKFFAIPHSENFQKGKEKRVSFSLKYKIKGFSMTSQRQLTGRMTCSLAATRCQCQTRIFLLPTYFVFWIFFRF